MEPVFERLNQVYRELSRSDLVTSRTTAHEAYAAFEKILNRAVPQTPEERGAMQFARSLFRCDNRGFGGWLHHVGMQGVAIWMDLFTLASMLGIEGVVVIHWNELDARFEVSRRENSEPRKYVPRGRPNFARWDTTRTSTTRKSSATGINMRESVPSARRNEPNVRRKTFRKSNNRLRLL